MTQEELDIEYMNIALQEARVAASIGEVPIGACVVYDNKVISKAHNLRETNKDPHAHAEFLALEKASRVLDRWRLTGCSVYVTLEPCVMCSGLMINSRVDRCVYGAADHKGGALGSLYTLQNDERLNHEFEVVSGVMQEECADVLKQFFKMRRKQNKAKKSQFTEVPDNTELDVLRGQIDVVDTQLLNLFLQRMEIVANVAKYKQEHNMDVLDTNRESQKIDDTVNKVSTGMREYTKDILIELMRVSREYQKKIIN